VVTRTASCLLLGALLAGAGSGCLLYTNHINHAPTVTVSGDTNVVFGTHPTFHAKAMDPDQSADTLTYEWHRQIGACPKPSPTADVGTGLMGGMDWVQDADLMADYCIWVVVSDAEGAATPSLGLTVTVTHRDPDAILEVVKPTATADDHYPLFTSFQLSSARSADSETMGGTLTRVFTLTRDGQPSTPARCPDAGETDVCFVIDQPGELIVDLMVTDSRGHHSMAEKKLTVDPDSPPCITQTMPQFGLPKYVRDPSDLTLEVTAVADDGDPFPASPQNLTFEWTWWLDGSTGEHNRKPDMRPRADFNNYFHPGDQINIRLRVTDRVNRDREFAACKPDDVTCAIGKDLTCFQWVTWKFDLRLGRDM
jgi:hypothetical protein